MSFKKGDLVKVKKGVGIFGISEDETYAVVSEGYDDYFYLVDDYNYLERMASEYFQKVEKPIKDPSPKKSPSKILFVKIDDKNISYEILTIVEGAFKDRFPEHEVILLSKNVMSISEVVDGKITILYDREKTVEPAPLDIASPGKEKPWWEYMPITVSTTTIDLSYLSMVHSTNYQTNIFDYLSNGEKKWKE